MRLTRGGTQLYIGGWRKQIPLLVVYSCSSNNHLVLSYNVIVLYSKDHKSLGMAHEKASPKNQPQFSLTTMRQYKPKQAFRLTRNAFNKLSQKNLIRGVFY